jgi:Protein of unknown function (DUF1295)
LCSCVFDHVARDIVNADHRITFRYVRHPNYLGEMMIYGSFALMVWHWLPFVVLAWVWIGLFAVNQVLTDPTYRQNARKLQKAIAEANGLSVAADLIEKSLGARERVSAAAG